MPTYRVHTFTSSANLVINSLTGYPSIDTIEYLVIGGGGGGGGGGGNISRGGGGGGAGGYRTGNLEISTEQTISVIIGAGGAGGSATSQTQTNGNSTIFSTIISNGGGYGGRAGPSPEGVPTGNRAGASNGNASGGGGGSPLGSSGPGGEFGNAGGAGGGGPENGSGGSGGGAGGAGTSGTANGSQTPGGIGLNSSISGTPVTRAVGGTGAPGFTEISGSAGGVNTGTGGGGGRGQTSTAGAGGGSGIVIIRYQLDANVIIPVQSKVSRVANIVANTSTVTTGDILEFTITTVNSANGEVLYYSTNNQPNAAFTSGNTGSFEINGNVGTVTLSVTAGGFDEEFFDLQVRRGSSAGPLLRQGGNVFIDIPTYLEATGGTIIDDAGYRIHVFTTTSNLDISTGPEVSNVEVVLVGGGGAGGYGTNFGFAGGGGGAGGVYTSNSILVSPGSYVITIGAGGIGGPSSTTSVTSGSNSSAFGYIALGGGAGGFTGPTQEHKNGKSGGSGGGAARNPAHDGTPGPAIPWEGVSQGNEGGKWNTPATPGAFGGGGGGGGGVKGFDGATVEPAYYADGQGGNGLPVVWFSNVNYGTPGPTPGRWLAGGGGAGGFPYPPSVTINRISIGGVGGGGMGHTNDQTPTSRGGVPESIYSNLANVSWNNANVNGIINTGGGGGGRFGFLGVNYTSTGGSGIVIIRYPYQ
jgi:hypothetical protein